jgi:iron complex transport system substrate-binding protein
MHTQRVLLVAIIGGVVLVAAVFLRVQKNAPVASGGSGEPRIVSLAPNLTETVFALGAGDQLVGVTSFCNFPPAAPQKENVGDFINPSVEKIISLEPDFVLAERWTSSKVSTRLSQLGIRVVETASPASFAEVYQVIEQVGETTGREEQARELLRDMKARVEAVRKRSRAFAYRPLVYVEIDPPSWTVGKNSYTSEAVFLAGGQNLFDDLNRPAVLVSKEKVLEKQPDVILSFAVKADEIRARAGWDQLPAVRNGRIIDDLNRDLLSRGTYRLIEGVEQLAGRLESMQDSFSSARNAPAP